MGVVQLSVERTMGASAKAIYGFIADMREHPRFLPPAFSDFTVEAGGVGAGTITTFALVLGGMTRQYRMQIAEPDPGRVLTESDTNSGTLTTWTVTPQGDDSCVVQLASRWDGAPGVAGFMERTFAPRVLRRLYADELRRLDWYARDHADE